MPGQNDDESGETQAFARGSARARCEERPFSTDVQAGVFIVEALSQPSDHIVGVALPLGRVNMRRSRHRRVGFVPSGANWSRA